MKKKLARLLAERIAEQARKVRQELAAKHSYRCRGLARAASLFALLVCAWPLAAQVSLTISQPSAEAPLLSEKAALSGEAQSPSGIASVTYSIDGGAAQSASITAPPSGLFVLPAVWSAAPDTTTLANGTHTLSVTATDAAGQASSQTRMFIVLNAVPGPPGPSGPPGPAGAIGPAGKNGTNGTNGVGILATGVNASGHLLVQYTTGTILDLGNVKGGTGAQGAQGLPGAPGAAGTPGIGISNVAINTSGHLIVTYTNGTTQDAGLLNASAPVNNAQAVFAPTGLAFPSLTIGLKSAPLTVTLSDPGTSLTTLTSFTITGANAADFSQTNNCGTQIVSGGSCKITVVFSPTVAGTESATLSVSDSAPNSPHTVTLTGTALNPVANGTGGLTISAPATLAKIGDSVSLTANRAVNWSLATGSLGTLTTVDSTHATYAAPATIPIQSEMGGCPAGPNDSIFNTRIDTLPLEARSATWTSSANVTSNGLGFEQAWGHTMVDPSTPTLAMSFYYTPASNNVFPRPKWPLLKREMGDFRWNGDGNDHHSVLIRKTDCTFYDLYNDVLVDSDSFTCRDGKTPGCNATSGLTYGQNYTRAPGSTDAAGLPLGPLTLHLDEILNNAIHHAMRFTLAAGYIFGDQQSVYWPASAPHYANCCTNSPPYGARFRLKASFDVSKFSPLAQNVLNALKQYGMILADAGTNNAIQTDSDLWRDRDVLGALSQISAAGLTIPNNFEVVDESSLMTSPGSYRVNAANPYQAPASFAGITATDAANAANTVQYPLALQGVGIGFPDARLYIAAGNYPYALPFWVTGTTNQSVTWTLTSGVGTVTPQGVYTPPSTVVGNSQTAILTTTSAADPQATAKLYLTVLPFSSDGNLRIASGSYTAIKDGSGYIWQPDVALETGIHEELEGDYPNWASLAGNPELAVYQAEGFTYGDDMNYRVVLPNGNYKIRVLMGENFDGCYTAAAPNCTPEAPSEHTPSILAANGQIALHNYSPGIEVGYLHGKPWDRTIPAQVVDNTLIFTMAGWNPDFKTFASAPSLNGIEIILDTAAPHLTLDEDGQATTLGAGKTLQFYAVGWYMSNAVTWSVSGGGTIDANGLYTAPATAPAAAVTITATSTASPTVTATASLTVQ